MHTPEDALRNVLNPAEEWNSRTRWGKFWMLFFFPADALIVGIASIVVAFILAVAGATLGTMWIIVKMAEEIHANWPKTYRGDSH